MEKNNLGEIILNHYEKYLGLFGDRTIFRGGEDIPVIQLLKYDNIFDECITYASFGFSKYSGIIGNTCETILSVDDDFEDAALIFANALFFIIKNRLEFGRGTCVDGIYNINREFADRHKKNAVYFTETYVFPDEFSHISNGVKMYLGFFISQDECNYLKEFGCEKFEDLLEERKCDVMDLDR